MKPFAIALNFISFINQRADNKIFHQLPLKSGIFSRVLALFNISPLFHSRRRFSDMLGAVLHVQHHGCHVHEAQLRLPAGRDRVHPHDLARVNLHFLPQIRFHLNSFPFRRYMNSFVNPVIYTIFNPEFRKAFKKIMNIG